MGPSMVLLKREVDFSHDEAVSSGVSIRPPWGRRGLPSYKVMDDAVIECLRDFKARAVVEYPPELSSLRILLRIPSRSRRH
ncbi:hypothetical protein ZWY2020_027178 [Hordeum vulgare]|nr:hypothetical protein ZWY2020_027178 [Hordeum vulgare]